MAALRRLLIRLDHRAIFQATRLPRGTIAAHEGPSAGAGAGGGYPQWNCNHPNSRRARGGDPAARPRTRSCIAPNANGADRVLCNASPDLRQQIGDNPFLHPREGLRHSPIKAVVLTNTDVGHITGLLDLRESQPLRLYATERRHVPK